MKDSQDWLVVVTGLYADYYANKITLGELSDGVESIAREHFLKEALELLKDWHEQACPNTKLEGSYCNRCSYCLVRDNHDFGEGYDFNTAELRNKFNDKYKED